MRRYSRFLLTNVLVLIASGAGFAAYGETVAIPMSDGAKLAADYFLPAGDGPFPVVVVRTVYGKGMGKGASPLFTTQGFALVIQDTRGRGESEGKDMVFADDGWGEYKDGADTIAWVKQQSWCNGKIGTWGMSALGITQIMEAGATKDIQAQAIVVAGSNFYDHLTYQGGVWLKSLCEGWLTSQKSTHVIPIWKSHPSYDTFWKGYNAEAKAAEINAPAIHIGGWWDIFQQGTINNFTTRQYQGGDGARGNQKLIIGPWPHGPKQDFGDLKLKDNFNYDFNKEINRFLTFWLKGDDNGIMKEPAVRYYTLGDVVDPAAPGNEWRTADKWPPFETNATSYYLWDDKTLRTDKPSSNSASLTYAYDPKNPCPTKGGTNLLIPAGPLDQTELAARPDVLTFASAPLAEAMEITGRVSVKLHVSSDAPDTDFTAKLLDIYPDGKQILMLDSIRRLKFRNSYEKAEPLPIGEVGELEIDLWSISLILNKGHRIGLQISSSNYPHFEKNPNTGDDFPDEANLRVAKNTVYANSAHLSALVLPIRSADTK